MSGRARPALGHPPEDVSGFPAREPVEETWHRAHATDRGPWWFSHDGSGRFDLTTPHGTCYLASTVEAALRERLGPTLLAAGRIGADEADRTWVSERVVQGRFADATDQDASRFGATREVGTLTPYDLPRAWAHAFHRAAFDGVRSWPRFSPGAGQYALGLFGPAGEDATPATDRTRGIPGRVAARLAGVDVIGVPRSMPVVDPPAGASQLTDEHP